MKVFGLAHIAIMAENYEETISFYTNLLQFKKAHHWSLEEYHIKEACMLRSLDGQTYVVEPLNKLKTASLTDK
ncbi:VOC family protein [Mammaliicoccus sciuri]|uniref:VOC family protein n=1 Tax=Mammaliicoccus sciuri TaxID=1296 RepID=UPI0019521062